MDANSVTQRVQNAVSSGVTDKVKTIFDKFTRYGPYPLLIPGLLFVALFFVVPIVFMLHASLNTNYPPVNYISVTVANYAEIFLDPYFVDIILRTLQLGLLVSVTATVVGYPVAYYITRTENRQRRLLVILLVVIPFLTSVIVRTFGWLIILLNNGILNTVLTGLGFGTVELINNFYGIYIGLVHLLLPVAVFSLMTSLSDIDTRLEHAARDLGASRIKVLTTVLLPLSWNGILGSFLTVFTVSISAFAVPSILGGTTSVMSTAINTYISSLNDFNMAGALAMTLMGLAIAIISVSSIVSSYQTSGIDL
jgi:putative spermidine/putrescine transport system permease protein